MEGHRAWFVSFVMIWRFLHAHWTTEMFSTLCHITADTSQMAKALRRLRGPGGTRYYHLTCRIVLLFGLTELKAQIDWVENVSWITLILLVY